VAVLCRAFTWVSSQSSQCAYSGGSGCFLKLGLVLYAGGSGMGGGMSYDPGAVSGKLLPNASYARELPDVFWGSNVCAARYSA
jgi:hypothetical protein